MSDSSNQRIDRLEREQADLRRDRNRDPVRRTLAEGAVVGHGQPLQVLTTLDAHGTIGWDWLRFR